MAGHVVRALLDRTAIRIDRQRPRGGADPLEPLAGEPAEVGAAREQIDQRAIHARRVREVLLGLERLAHADQREHVAGIFRVPLLRDLERLVGVAAPHRTIDLGERSPQRLRRARRRPLLALLVVAVGVVARSTGDDLIHAVARVARRAHGRHAARRLRARAVRCRARVRGHTRPRRRRRSRGRPGGHGRLGGPIGLRLFLLEVGRLELLVTARVLLLALLGHAIVTFAIPIRGVQLGRLLGRRHLALVGDGLRRALVLRELLVLGRRLLRRCTRDLRDPAPLLEARGSNDKDVGQRLAVDAIARVVTVALEHEHRGLARDHACRDGLRRDLVAQRLPLRTLRIVELHLQLRDLGRCRRALDERRRATGHADRALAARDGHLDRLHRRGHLRVDHRAAGSPCGLDDLRIHPLGARDLHRHVDHHALAETGHHIGEARIHVEHGTGAREAARHERGRERLVADAAGEHDVDPLDLPLRELADRAAEVRVGRAGRHHTVGDHDQPLPGRLERSDRLAEVRGSGRTARDQRPHLRLADVHCAAREQRLRVLIECDQLEL